MNGFGKPIPKELMSLEDLRKKVQSMRDRLWETERGTFIQRSLRGLTLRTLRIEASQCLSYSYEKVSLLSLAEKRTLEKILAVDGVIPQHVKNILNPPAMSAAAD